MDYLMLRGIFTTPGASQEVVDFYVGLFKKVRATPEWAAFMDKGAFNQSFMTGKAFRDWVAETEQLHRTLMTDAGFLAKKK